MIRRTTHCRFHRTPLPFCILVLCALSAAGCASSGSSQRYITSFVDPAFLGRRFARLVVHYETSDLQYRSAVEEALVDALHDREANAVQSSGIILPTRAWDSAGVHTAIGATGFDGYVRIVETDRWTETYHVPSEEKTTVKREIEEKKVPDGRRRGEQQRDSVVRITETQTSTTTTSGGYTGEVVKRQFRIELIEVSTGRTAWLGTSTISGSVVGNAESFGKRVAAQLRQDGMFVIVE